MAANVMAAPGDRAPGGETGVQMSAPKLRKVIDLTVSGTSLSTVRKMKFSPDSRYLAIAENTDILKADVVIWDMLEWRQHVRIHLPYDYAGSSGWKLFWSADGKIISFASRRQWDTVTGEALPDRPVVGRDGRLNKDGSKLLTIVGEIGVPSDIYVYDTKTWTAQKLHLDGLAAETAAWTADDRIVVGAAVTRESKGKMLDGHLAQIYDVALRVIDPSGKDATRTLWFPAAPTGDSKHPYSLSFPIGSHMEPNFSTNEIFFGAGKVFGVDALKIRKYSCFDKEALAPGAFGMGFSPDGKLLYLKGASLSGGDRPPIQNSIVDVQSGKPVLQFNGAMDHQGGLAVSPDGKTLALGDSHSIFIFDLK